MLRQMNILHPWNLVFLIGFVVYFSIRHTFIKRTRDVPKADSRIDRLEKFLLFLMVPAILVLPFLYWFTPLLSFADYSLPLPVLLAGLVAMIASLWLFWRSHVDLGDNWSVSLEISEGHQIVSNGVYRSIRHPMYASIWLWGLAQGMLLENWLAGWAVIPVFALMYFLRTPKEEKLMCEHFGDSYRQYMNCLLYTSPSPRDRG